MDSSLIGSREMAARMCSFLWVKGLLELNQNRLDWVLSQLGAGEGQLIDVTLNQSGK